MSCLKNGYGQYGVDRSIADTTSFVCSVEPFYQYRTDGKVGRAVVIFPPPGDKSVKRVVVNCEGKTEQFSALHATTDSITVLLPDGAGVKSKTFADIILETEKQSYKKTIEIQPKRQWTVFIYPHSHLDIGYTGLQEDVEKLHVRNIDVGIDLAKKTQHYPQGARFIWNTEATWVVKAYLKKATPAQKQSFVEAVRKGWVQVDGGFANLNTTTCSDEELLRFFQDGNEIEKLTKVPITTMVQMDVPGAAWGLVQAAAQNGVKGFISFPNYFDLRKAWEHKPFYWKGPNAKSKILFLQAYPYGIGYTIKGSKYGLAKLQTFSKEYDRVSTSNPLQNFIDPFIFDETAKLEERNTPYDYFVMTWSMADNCVIDADLPEAVKQWNTTYAYPKLVIAGAKEILAAYEKKYSNLIPEYSGDFTEFWTDGLGSDAAHVGMGRRAKENLVQAETLWTILNTRSFPGKEIKVAWEDILLSAEHTWGYQTPTAPLAKVIEKRKASFFSEAEAQSNALIKQVGDSSTTDEQYAVVNTLSWDRSGIVTLTPLQSKRGDRVIDVASGKAVLSQRLTTGELIFQSNVIPALSSKLYKVVSGRPPQAKNLIVTTTVLRNDFLSISVDPKSGNVSGVIGRRHNYDYVVKASGLNSYHYLPGVYNGKNVALKPSTADSVTISVKEKGPLLVSLLIRSKAGGTTWLKREVKLFDHARYLQIQNSFDKIGTRKKEGIHFGFAFNLPNAISHMDAPWSIIIPEVNQLKGANRNWTTFQRWVDVSNTVNGITWTAIESPLIEWSEMSGTILDGARQYWLWKKELLPSSTLYSWPLNNHWDTNFPLEQSGIINEQYAVLFHGAYDAVAANRFGTEQHRPLLVVPAKTNLLNASFVRLDNPRVAVSTIKQAEDQNGVVLRLRSFSENEEVVKLQWANERPQRIQRCTAEELVSGQVTTNEITLSPFGAESLYLTF